MLATRLLVALAAVVIALIPEAANAAQGTSGVQVRPIFGPPRQPVQVSIRLESDSVPGLVRRAVVEPSRSGWFAGLPEGDYLIAVEVPGLAAAMGRVHVGAGEVASVDVTFPATGEPVVALRARWRDMEGAAFSGALLEDLPSAGDFWSLIETAAPFVVADRMDTGGLGTARSALVGGRGESWATTSLLVGDAPIRFPTLTGQLPFSGAALAIESVTVGSGLAPADVATPGTYIRLAPKRAGSRASIGGNFSATTPSMVGDNQLPHAPSIATVDHWRHGGVFAGGPIGPKTGLFVAVDSSSVDYAERGRLQLQKVRTTNVFGHLVRRTGDAGELRVLGGFEGGEAPFDGRRQFLDRSVTSTNTFGRLQLTWDRVGPSGSRRSLSVGGQRARWSPDVSSSRPGGVVDRVLDGVVPPPAAVERRLGWNVRAELNSRLMTVGRSTHAFRVGVTTERVREASAVQSLPTVAESVDGLAARVWVPVDPSVSSARGLTDAALYVSDRMAVGRTLVIEAGLRAEASYGSARGAARGLAWATVLPRVSFRWQPRGFSVYGGAGEYVAANPLNLLTFGDPGTVAFAVHRWDDANRNTVLDSGETGVLVARRGRNRSIAEIDDSLEAPISRELSIGAEFRPNARSTIGAAITIRRTRRLVGSVNEGVPFSSYRPFTVPDIGEDEGHPGDDQPLVIYERRPESFGADAYRLTNPPGAKATYGGIEISWAITGRRWNMLFGATAYRTRGSGGDINFGPLENDPLVIGDHYENPNSADDVPGSFFFDRSYVGKWSGSYRAPGDIRTAFAVRYQDGQPFTRLVVAPDLAGGPEVVHAYRVGRTRFTYTATVDLRLEKGFSFGQHRVALHLDVFNLTNHANEVEEDVVSGPLFRLSTAVQPPRTLRAGFSLRF
jgi:hypothetical protein